MKFCFSGVLSTDDSYHQYTAYATARGQGRNGEVTSDGDGGLALHLAMPKSLGGKGDGQNPEQLFAMGVSFWLASGFDVLALT